MPRRVDGLLWAEECQKPKCIPNAKLKGVQAKGVAFERKLRKALPRNARNGVWFRYTDVGGSYYCSPDWLVPRDGKLLVLEVKLTRIADARTQLEGLYVPVVSATTKTPVIGVPLVKSLSRWNGIDKVANGLDEYLECYQKGEPAVVHWVGVGRL